MKSCYLTHALSQMSYHLERLAQVSITTPALSSHFRSPCNREFYSLSRHFWENPAHRTHSFYKLVYFLIEYNPYTKISLLKHINLLKGIERRIWKKMNLWNMAYQRIGRWSGSNKVIQTKHVSHESYVLPVCVKTKVTWSRGPRNYILSDFSMV